MKKLLIIAVLARLFFETLPYARDLLARNDVVPTYELEQALNDQSSVS